MATQKISEGIDSVFPALSPASNGLGDWSARNGTGSQKRNIFFGLDLKRILALSGVFVTHTMVFGAMLLPAAPASVTAQTQSVDIPWVELTALPPPPPPPPPPTPPVAHDVVVATPRPAPTVIAPIIQVATIAAPSEEIGTPITPTIVDPPASIGGNLRDSILDTISAPAPPYPANFIRAGIGGTVEFTVLVGTDGKAIDIKLMKSSGNRRLDQSTLSHIKRRWRFKPQEIDGAAVESWGRGKVTFTMEG
jgi:periplasmic protein TonB